MIGTRSVLDGGDNDDKNWTGFCQGLEHKEDIKMCIPRFGFEALTWISVWKNSFLFVFNLTHLLQDIEVNRRRCSITQYWRSEKVCKAGLLKDLITLL